MFKKNRHGITILSLALAFIAGTANARSYPCNSIKTGTSGLKATTCDVSFSVVPTFACLLGVDTGVYTITNNTRSAIKINYIRILSKDALPAADSVVVASANSCVVGGSLAAGASCNIQVNLNSTTFPAVFNRVLQVGVNTRQVEVDAPLIATMTLACPLPPGPPFPPTFACTVLAASAITNTGPTFINGNICLSPDGPSSITGFPPGTFSGMEYAADATAAAAQLQLTAAYNALAAMTCTADLSGMDLAGMVLAPGVYCFSSSAAISVGGVLTLNGPGQYVFKIGSSLTLNNGSSVLLTGGATSNNVFWQVGSSATIGTTAVSQGTIAAMTSITVNTGATIFGYALASTGAVTLDDNMINPAL